MILITRGANKSSQAWIIASFSTNQNKKLSQACDRLTGPRREGYSGRHKPQIMIRPLDKSAATADQVWSGTLPSAENWGTFPWGRKV